MILTDDNNDEQGQNKTNYAINKTSLYNVRNEAVRALRRFVPILGTQPCDLTENCNRYSTVEDQLACEACQQSKKTMKIKKNHDHRFFSKRWKQKPIGRLWLA